MKERLIIGVNVDDMIITGSNSHKIIDENECVWSLNTHDVV